MNKLLNLKFDKKTIKLINSFSLVSFIFFFISLILLYVFYKFYISITFYKSSLILLRTGLLINVFSIICGICVTNIKNENF